MTREELQATRDKVKRGEEILRDLKRLESERGKLNPGTVRDNAGNINWLRGDTLLIKVLKLGIDTLIAQLEQELADLDKPKVAMIPQFSFATPPPPTDCPICKRPCMGHNDAGMFQVPNEFYPPGNAVSGTTAEVCHDPHRVMSTAQIERYPVVSGVRGTMRRDDADRLLDDDETRVASTIRWNAERNILELVESARESNSKAWDLTESQWNKITAQSRATYIPQRDGEYEATEPAEAAQ